MIDKSAQFQALLHDEIHAQTNVEETKLNLKKMEDVILQGMMSSVFEDNSFIDQFEMQGISLTDSQFESFQSKLPERIDESALRKVIADALKFWALEEKL